MAGDIFDILILNGHPASGKSETIDFLKKTPEEERRERFHIGAMDEIDDFPMLWTWFEEDAILEKILDHPRMHTDKDGFFLYQYQWDLLIERISLDDSQARVTLREIPDTPGLAAQVFGEIAEAGILVDMIVQSMGRAGHANLSFTVPQTELDRSLKLASQLAEGFGSPSPTSSPRVAKLSVTGTGMRSHTSVATRMLRSLANAEINVDMISTSEVRVNVVVDGAQGEKALKALQQEFADVML